VLDATVARAVSPVKRSPLTPLRAGAERTKSVGGTWQPGGCAEFVTTPDMLLYETTYLSIAAP
jgi:hypothetical protein